MYNDQKMQLRSRYLQLAIVVCSYNASCKDLVADSIPKAQQSSVFLRDMFRKQCNFHNNKTIFKNAYANIVILNPSLAVGNFDQTTITTFVLKDIK